jgi:APA family basic amino acid/polyamine antiporter
MIGGGIFLTPSTIARALPEPRWILGAWILGGLLTIAGGFVYSELGTMMPEAGGTYVYLREAYGPLTAFLYGWMACFVIESGALAAVAVGFSQYLGAFFPGLASRHWGPASAGQLVAIAAVLALSATHYVGIKEGVRIQGFFTSLILVTMAALSLGGLFGAQRLASAVPGAGAAPGALGVVLVAVLWTYYGWNEALTAAGEVREPSRNIPIAMLAGTGLVTLLYVGVNAAFLKVIPLGELSGLSRPAEVASGRLFGSGASFLVSGAIVAMALGCASASIVPGPRIAYALAKDGVFPAAFAATHPRFRTPSLAILLQALWTSVLCLSGRYDQLYTYATFAVILAYSATGFSLFVFRKTRPDAPRPYRCWGYPVVPAVFVASSLLIVASTLWTQPRETLAGLLILAVGLPFYFWRVRRRGARA